MKNIKKLLLSLGVITTFIAYSWHQRNEGSSAQLTEPNPTASSPAPASDLQTSVAPQNASQQTDNQASSTYNDGTYTGPAADAYYGYIQVQAVIKNGKLTDVVFLQYPNDQENSIYINTQAMPYLKREAIQAQSANVNSITGATDTVQAFVQSLTDALNQAKRGV